LITIKQGPGDTVVATQTVNRPTIYLDQWMWCRLSEDTVIRNEFLDVARAVNATIMYSLISFLELGKISDPRQITALKSVMDELDFGFIEMNPRTVIDIEISSETTHSTFADFNPAVDRELIKYIASHLYHGDISRVSLIIDAIAQEASSRFHDIAQRFADGLAPVVEIARNRPSALHQSKQRIRKRLTQRSFPPYTRDLYQVVLDFIVSNKTMRMSPNEWIDVFHMVVPVSYLDFVLLDRRWKSFVKQTFPIHPPNIAQVYCDSELRLFLDALRTYQAP